MKKIETSIALSKFFLIVYASAFVFGYFFPYLVIALCCYGIGSEWRKGKTRNNIGVTT